MDSEYRLEYLLGLLNSKMYQWRFKLTSTNNNVGTNELESMPFRTIDFMIDADRNYHNGLVLLVERNLSLHILLNEAQTSHDRTVLQRQIDATDRQIDLLVYELYGLTAEEIAIVEGAT